MIRTPFQNFMGTIALFLPLVSSLILRQIRSEVIGLTIAILSCAATTALFFVAFDRRVSKFDFLPFLDVTWKRILLTGFTYGIWTLVAAAWFRDPAMVDAVFTVPFYAFLIALPTCGLCVLIRRQLLPPGTDCFLRCRVCDYRVDNLPGPRCPECGTVIDGSYEAPA